MLRAVQTTNSNGTNDKHGWQGASPYSIFCYDALSYPYTIDEREAAG